MFKLFLNNEEFELTFFNHQISIKGNDKESNAMCNIKNKNDAFNVINNLTETSITSFVVKNDNNVEIYNLNNINAHITNINAYLNNDEVSLDITLTFEY